MYGLVNNYGFFPPIMGGKSNKDVHLENHYQLFDCYTNLVDLFLNTFEWTGLPETCNERALETTLLYDGKALIFQHHDNTGIYNCPFSFDGSSVNFYGEYTKYKTKSPTYMEQTYDDTNAVVIRNTNTMFPSWITLDIYSKKMVDCQRTIDIYQRTMKRPYIIAGTKDSKLTIHKIMQDTECNEYYHIINKNNFDPNDIKFFPIPTDPQNMYALWDNLHNLQSEFNKRMGINSTNVDKAERLVTAETEQSVDITKQNINTLLDARLKSCEKVNELFGLNVSCKLKNEQEQDSELLMYNEEQEVGETDDKR